MAGASVGAICRTWTVVPSLSRTSAERWVALSVTSAPVDSVSRPPYDRQGQGPICLPILISVARVERVEADQREDRGAGLGDGPVDRVLAGRLPGLERGVAV